MLAVNPEFWAGRRVLVTGHTGFKGSWLSFWLRELGAESFGLALAPETEPALYDLLGIDRMPGMIADITDTAALAEAFERSQPEIVLHLAAQALVRESFETPVETFATNVVGTAAVLDAVRRTPSVRSVVVITSDKCYENREWEWGYRESDPLGGYDPYSASKGAAEIVVASMRRSYFAPYRKDGHPARIASVRAGNVIGGGDWSKDRLVPDIIRGALSDSGEVVIRSPGAVRPWQHVMEPLAAYLGLAERLYNGDEGVDQAFNFGPSETDNRPVLEVAEALVEQLGCGHLEVRPPPNAPHEAHLLRLDCSKARLQLGWAPRLDFGDTVALTAQWYSAVAKGEDPSGVTATQIKHFSTLNPR
ncbi:CDP-glucose 4,6-dehydratase [Sphingomonas sp. AOB5]|uniref:CDP-glucose 4,6-dehydratase n=1 Tax=Sphingomonas sp. AOB5 TaxID=3034017 RepID=UPI0023F94410|nr:CDP-glucose 4,6-dehydratase [Sphingomonas sp. AOB5]MDF7774413.1 CDP-glucose 4,6-dehydratase [Sphingomonas sp. AOB5]